MPMRHEEINIYQAPIVDQRIARCRHSRLRNALQFRQPNTPLVTVPKEETLYAKPVKMAPGPEFTPWERAAVTVVKGILTFGIAVITFLTQPINTIG